MGSDALQKLKLHYHVNKASLIAFGVAKCALSFRVCNHHCAQAIAKGAESLFLTVTQKVSILGDMCQEGMKEMYGDLVQLLVVAATRLREEVRRGERETQRSYIVCTCTYMYLYTCSRSRTHSVEF